MSNLGILIFFWVWWKIEQNWRLPSGETFLTALIVTATGFISCHLFISALRRKNRGSMALAALAFWAGGFLCLAPQPLPTRIALGSMVAAGLIASGFACRMLDKHVPVLRRHLIACRYWIACLAVAGGAFAVWLNGERWEVTVSQVLQIASFGIPFVCGWMLGSSASRKPGDARVGLIEDFTKAGVSDDR
jgi:hypothetical protein